MIIGNVLKFGYGDIAVGYMTSVITFQWFKPPAECGGRVPKDTEWLSEKICLDISYDDYHELSKYLEMVSDRSISEFTFKGYVFDFTNYNEESVNVCKKYLEGAMRWYTFCCAC